MDSISEQSRKALQNIWTEAVERGWTLSPDDNDYVGRMVMLLGTLQGMIWQGAGIPTDVFYRTPEDKRLGDLEIAAMMWARGKGSKSEARFKFEGGHSECVSGTCMASIRARCPTCDRIVVLRWYGTIGN